VKFTSKVVILISLRSPIKPHKYKRKFRLFSRIGLTSKQIFALTPLLCFDQNRTGQRSGADVGQRLHPDGVNAVRRELTDGGQLVVVDDLRAPLTKRQIRVLRVVHFVALRNGLSLN
jgi:hypothetical protein